MTTETTENFEVLFSGSENRVVRVSDAVTSEARLLDNVAAWTKPEGTDRLIFETFGEARSVLIRLNKRARDAWNDRVKAARALSKNTCPAAPKAETKPEEKAETKKAETKPKAKAKVKA